MLLYTQMHFCLEACSHVLISGYLTVSRCVTLSNTLLVPREPWLDCTLQSASSVRMCVCLYVVCLHFEFAILH